MEEIFTRRSIRKYTNQEIEEDILKQILKAGMNAPTARNLKPFEFILVREKSILEQLSQTKKNAYFVKESSATIVVLGKKLSEFWQQDLGAVTQNILLEATHFNIGSCWIGITPNEGYEECVRETLSIPEDLRVFSMISLGYPAEVKEKNDSCYEDRVHYELYKKV